MNPITNMPNTTVEKMKTVKAAWDKAPAGAKKDAAHVHFVAAEKALAAKRNEDCVRELDAATKSLG